VGMHSHTERGNESRLSGCGKFIAAGRRSHIRFELQRVGWGE